MRTRLRRMRRYEQILVLKVAKLERQGVPLVEALRVVMLDPAESHSGRAAIGRVLSISRDDQAVQALLKLFFEQTEKSISTPQRSRSNH